MKRLLWSIVLALVIVFGGLTGCGGEAGDDEEGVNPGLVQPGEGGEDEEGGEEGDD
jgi:hypothetical protein